MDTNQPASYKFTNGLSFWYRSRGTTDVTITISGGVSLDASQSIEIVNGFNMIGNAFPANFNPNSLGTEYWKNCGAKAGSSTDADEIQIYNPNTSDYKKYYLFYSTLVFLQGNNYKWIDLDTNQPVSNEAEVMAAGKGAWYRHRGNGFTLTIPSPISE